MNDFEVCGHCKFRKFYAGEWICSNPDSDLCGLEMDYTDKCFDWEEKE